MRRFSYQRSICALALVVLTGCSPDPIAAQVRATVAGPVPTNLDSFDPLLVDEIKATLSQIGQQGTDLEAWSKLGKLYEAHMLHELAIQAYATVVEQDPNNAQIWYRLALCHESMGAIDASLKAFRKVHELAPTYVPAWRNYALLLFEMGHLEEAQLAFEQALQHNPEDESSLLGLIGIQLRSGNAEGALAALTAQTTAGMQSSPHMHRLRGQALARLGRDQEAAMELAQGESAKAGGPDPWSKELMQFKVGESVLLLRSERLMKRGHIQAALKVLQPLEHERAGDGRVWRQLGQLYTMLERHADASRSFGRACQLQPTDARAWLSAAVAQMANEECALAVQSSARALEIEPQLSDAALLRAQCLMDLERYDDVVAMLANSQLEEPERTTLECAAGKARLSQGRIQAALKHFSSALERMDACEDAWAGTAMCHLQLGELEVASQAIEHLASVAPGNEMLTPLRAGLAQELNTIEAQPK